MAVRPIIRMGHPTLRQVARPLTAAELGSPEVAALVADMTDTLRDAGGVGLAAPQINVPVRLAIIEIEGGETRYGDLPAMPLTIFANPVVKVVSSDPLGCWEGCLSVPGLRGWVERPSAVQVRYQDLDGTHHEMQLDGFFATVLQHEFDHLDGRLYVDRMTDTTRLVFEREFAQFWLPQNEEA